MKSLRTEVSVEIIFVVGHGCEEVDTKSRTADNLAGVWEGFSSTSCLCGLTAKLRATNGTALFVLRYMYLQ